MAKDKNKKRRIPFYIFILVASALITATSVNTNGSGLTNYLAYWRNSTDLNYTNATVHGISTWYFDNAPYNNSTGTFGLYVSPATTFLDGYMTASQVTSLNSKALAGSCTGWNSTHINVTMNATTSGVQCFAVQYNQSGGGVTSVPVINISSINGTNATGSHTITITLENGTNFNTTISDQNSGITSAPNRNLTSVNSTNDTTSHTIIITDTSGATFNTTFKDNNDGNVTGDKLNSSALFHVMQLNQTALTTSNVSETQFALLYPNSLVIDGASLLVNSTNNRVGINTSFPTSTLDVYGNLSVATTLSVNGSLFTSYNTNRTGINNTKPTSTLDVTGNASISGSFNLNSQLFYYDVASGVFNASKINVTNYFSVYGTNNTDNKNPLFVVDALKNNTSISGNVLVNNIPLAYGQLNYMPYYFYDFTFIPGSSVVVGNFWGSNAISSGTSTGGGVASNASHPGIATISDSTTAGGGYVYLTDTAALLLGGGENFSAMYQQKSKPTGGFNTHTRIGFFDSSSGVGSTAVVDGCFFSLEAMNSSIGNQAIGICKSNSASTNTSTNYTYLNNTWYLYNVYINPGATSAVFSIYNETGSLLYQNSVSSNIPTAAGRNTGAGIGVWQNNSDAAGQIATIDYISFSTNRPLRRGWGFTST